MTASYKGTISVRDQWSGRKIEYRLAEVMFNEDEMPKVERVIFLMRIKGWEIDLVTDGYAQCVVEDRDEFKAFMADWKESKRCISNCMKFGF